jgi:hypothetical protein
MRKNECHEISGEEKERYLKQLDGALGVLVQCLVEDRSRTPMLKEFGDRNAWDWDRLPKQDFTYKTLAELAGRVKGEYRWFDWQVFPAEVQNNCGYFERLGISSASGLPWFAEFTELHRLKRDAAELLRAIPEHRLSAKGLSRLLMTDEVESEAVPQAVYAIHKNAMRRNFLERLRSVDLLGWQTIDFSLPPRAKKIIPLGGEDLWSIDFLKFNPASGMFEAYVIDVWQDLREPQIHEEENGIKLSEAFQAVLKTCTEDSAAWFVLKEIDDSFRSLHPVHVSKALIGPFENRYMTNPQFVPLNITAELLREDGNTGILRFSRQYSYAPNHEPVGEEIRQVVYREKWADEVIVCPANCSSRVANSVLGTNVKILEAK